MAVNVINLLDELTAVDILTGKTPVKIIYRDKLADRLNISPKERISLTVMTMGDVVAVSCLLDGGDLTPQQEVIFKAFLEETGAFTAVLGVFPERPVTS